MFVLEHRIHLVYDEMMNSTLGHDRGISGQVQECEDVFVYHDNRRWKIAAYITSAGCEVGHLTLKGVKVRSTLRASVDSIYDAGDQSACVN